jgi:hypothetical protein
VQLRRKHTRELWFRLVIVAVKSGMGSEPASFPVPPKVPRSIKAPVLSVVVDFDLRLCFDIYQCRIRLGPHKPNGMLTRDARRNSSGFQFAVHFPNMDFQSIRSDVTGTVRTRNEGRLSFDLWDLWLVRSQLTIP